jgi:hypothetical protein
VDIAVQLKRDGGFKTLACSEIAQEYSLALGALRQRTAGTPLEG